MLLERDGVVEAVGELLDGTRDGNGAALFVLGEAGLGKTVILDHARKVAAPFARVGLARGDVMESGLPFGLMAALLEDLGAGGLLSNGNSQFVADTRVSQLYRTLRWLRELSTAEPVLLAIDDIHWSDPDSLGLLSYVCRRIRGRPIGVVATLRPWPPATEELCLRLARSGHARVERLHPLSEAATRRFILGRAPRLPEETIGAVASSSAGNPFLLEQSLRAIEIAARPDATDLGPTGTPRRCLDRLLLARFGGLPEAGILCARAAAVLGSRFRPELAVAVAGLDEAQAEVALAALSHSGLIRYVGAGLAEFTHPLFFQGLYDELPPILRVTQHARAFHVLAERGLEAEAAPHATLAHLVGNAQAIEVLASAGKGALRAGAVASAVEHLESAAALAGERRPIEVLMLLGEALVADGGVDRAIEVYDQILEQPDLPAAARAEALRMLARALFLSGQHGEGERRFEEAIALVRADRPLLALQTVLDLSRAAWLTAGPAGALPVARRARELARDLDEGSRAQAEAAWGFVAFVSGDPQGLEAALQARTGRVVGDGSVLRDLSWNWGTLRNRGRAAKYAERFADAESVFDAMFEKAQQAESPHAIVSLASHHADTLGRQGRLDAAIDLATRAVALAELAPMAAAFAHVVEAWLFLQADRLAESEECCQQGERVASAQGQWLPLLRVWHVRARRALAEGDLERCGDLYGQLEAATIRLGINEPCLVPWAQSAVVAHVGRGHVEHARSVLRWLDGPAHTLPCRWPRIAARAGAGTVADASDDRAAAEVHFRAALRLHAEVNLPVERVETLLQFGSFLRRAGRVVEAREALREAMALAEAIGARWLGRLLSEELSVAGGRRRRRGAKNDLTPQERRVADLAASGRNAREIANQLSLSVRTVQTHLYRIYTKLGVHSQRELMATMGRIPPR